MGEGPDADAAAPTEMAGTADAETQSVHAWALDDEQDDAPPQRLTPRRITTAAVVASLLVTAAAAVITANHLSADRPTQAHASTTEPPPAVAAPPPAPPPIPTTPKPPELEGVDAEFIADMRGYGVPVSDQDPGWDINMAHAICATVHDAPPGHYPPGVHTVIMLTEGMMGNNPGWTPQQASRFTDGAVDYYCPDVRGPSQREIAAMPPDERFLAMLQDRLGITPVDDSIIRVGRQVCIWKGQGWRTDQMVDGINSPNSRDDEQVIVETAMKVYCPAA